MVISSAILPGIECHKIVDLVAKIAARPQSGTQHLKLMRMLQVRPVEVECRIFAVEYGGCSLKAAHRLGIDVGISGLDETNTRNKGASGSSLPCNRNQLVAWTELEKMPASNAAASLIFILATFFQAV